MKNYNTLYIFIALMSLYNPSVDALFGYTIKNPEIAKVTHKAYVEKRKEAQQKACEKAAFANSKIIMNYSEPIFGPEIPRSENEKYKYFKYSVAPSAQVCEDESKSHVPYRLMWGIAQTVHLSLATAAITELITNLTMAYVRSK